MAKDRCKQNTEILKKIIAELPPMEVIEEDRAIRKELERFCKLPDKIQYAIDLLNNTRPYLTTIKNRLGSTNAFYLKLSTQVVGNALHNIIEEINSMQKSLEFRLSISFGYEKRKLLENDLKPLLQDGWKAIKLMDKFDLEFDFKKNRYNPNRQSFKNMYKQIVGEKEINPIVAVLIIHTVWGLCIMSPRDEFWEGFLCGIAGWIFPINMIGYYILNWIYQKINE